MGGTWLWSREYPGVSFNSRRKGKNMGVEKQKKQ